jgi:hypothetical protein
MADPFAYLGSGLVVPFRRDGKDDFAHETGEDLVASTLKLVVGTRRAGPQGDGEVPFNQELGTLISLLRHRNINDPTTEELATHYVIEALAANEPRIRPKAVGFQPRPESNRIALRLRYDLVDRGTTGINVIARDIETEVEI